MHSLEGEVMALNAACSSSGEPAASPTESTAVPQSTGPATTIDSMTSSSVPVTTIDVEFLTRQVNRSWDPERPGSVMMMTFDARGDSVSAAVGPDFDGESMSIDDPIRVGSITKLLTSTTMLSLVDEGLVELERH